MADANHTSGEWSVLEHEGEVFILANGAMQIAAVTYVIEHAGEQGSRRLQNARLMAAAPGLLELLVELDNNIERLGHGHYALESRDGFDAQGFMDLVRWRIGSATTTTKGGLA